MLLRNHRELPALLCEQRKAPKCVPTEEDIRQSNINGFGDDIGVVTNHVTSMYDALTKFEKGSVEYREISNRIQCGEHYQQASIDRVKGIVSEPMPKYWHNRHAVAKEFKGNEEKLRFHMSIVADRKPYFMKYIYPDLMQKYKKYMDATRRSCLMEFRMEPEELLAIPEDDMTKRQREFVKFYRLNMPVSTADSTMNRICRRVETEFDGIAKRLAESVEFDYNIMKSGASYKASQKKAIRDLMEGHRLAMKEYVAYARRSRVDRDDARNRRMQMAERFRRECEQAVPDSLRLCDIVLDLCYGREGTKQFAWDVCAEQIIENLHVNRYLRSD